MGKLDREDVAEVTVAVREPASNRALPVRAMVESADGEYVDGAGYGLYADGRFFVEGEFTVELPAGEAKLTLASGPNHVPAAFELDVPAGRRLSVTVGLPEWFSPQERGWYGADNHVHAQHDAHAAVSTGLPYTALQARANGLNYVTEAGSNVDYGPIDDLDTDVFLIRRGNELRPGPFVGHLNTPGITEQVSNDRFESWRSRPLPVQRMLDHVHELGGAVTYTHPLTPPQQLHWMGATALFSDAATGRTADGMDIDARHTELFWYSVLNLGNRLAATASTDAALGRVRTLSPGDRRVYVQADELTPAAIAEGIREGRTVATNGGPIFPLIDVAGYGPGDTIRVTSADSLTVEIEVRSFHPLLHVELFQRGVRVAAFNVGDRAHRGHTEWSTRIDVQPDQPGWIVARVQDVEGHWAITSPVYFEPATGHEQPVADASAIVFQIGNQTRFIELRPDFFAHIIATVPADQAIAEVQLLRDEQVAHRFTPDEGDQLADGQTPVTGPRGDYAPGWVWHGDDDRPHHFQADWPVAESGWYAVRVLTADGRTITSDAARFRADHPDSHQLSIAHLQGGDTALTIHGYGEEMPIEEIDLPFEGDHWWYPRRTYFHMHARFGSDERTLQGGDSDTAQLFRTPAP